MQTSAVVSEALAIQRQIIAELAATYPMEQKLENISRAFAQATNAKQALIYATIDDNYLEYMGGFHAEDYKTNIRYNENVIGKSAAAKRPLQEVDALRHASVLSVPIIRLNNTTGTIVIIKNNNEYFNEQTVDLVETLTLVLTDLTTAKNLLIIVIALFAKKVLLCAMFCTALV